MTESRPKPSALTMQRWRKCMTICAKRRRVTSQKKRNCSKARPNSIDGLKAKAANYDYSILGHQISVGAYEIVDRCEVCHAGIREPVDMVAADLAPDGPGKTPDSLARAFVSHPNREVLRVHNPEKFGCASCHWGNGRATTSDTKGHGRHRFWLWPMFEKENTEAGCRSEERRVGKEC